MTDRAPSTVEDRIAAMADELTPTDRRIARLIIDDPTTPAFGTLADVARRADTSGPSVVRFATKLGFDGYSDLQSRIRASLTQRLIPAHRPIDRIRSGGDGADDGHRVGGRSDAHASSAVFFTNADRGTLSVMADTVAAARRVMVVCAETSAAPGLILATNLGLLRPGVSRLPTSAAGQASVVDHGPDDVAIAIDFPRYERSVVAATRNLATNGCPVVALTDGPLSPLAAVADAWLGLEVRPVGPFDSVVTVVAAAELLVAEVAERLRRTAGARLDRIEAAWVEADVFLERQ